MPVRGGQRCARTVRRIRPDIVPHANFGTAVRYAFGDTTGVCQLHACDTFGPPALVHDPRPCAPSFLTRAAHRSGATYRR
jgi:hypothetical protein